MKLQMQWAALVTGLIVLIAGSLGCATMAASSIGTSDAEFHNNPILTDEIIAIGRPDPALAQQMKQPNVIAFIGKKNTYMLYKGGDELEKISKLNLDGRRMDIDASRSRHLYQKDKQIWGDLILTYSTVSNDEISLLDRGSFTAVSGDKSNVFQKKVSIEGVIYPALKIPEDQMSKLTTGRPFNLYNPLDAKPPILVNILKVPLVIVGVATDIVLIPVYVGATTIFLISGGVKR